MAKETEKKSAPNTMQEQPVINIECNEAGRQILLGVSDLILKTQGRNGVPVFNLLEKSIPKEANLKV